MVVDRPRLRRQNAAIWEESAVPVAASASLDAPASALLQNEKNGKNDKDSARPGEAKPSMCADEDTDSEAYEKTLATARRLLGEAFCDIPETESRAAEASSQAWAAAPHEPSVAQEPRFESSWTALGAPPPGEPVRQLRKRAAADLESE